MYIVIPDVSAADAVDSCPAGYRLANIGSEEEFEFAKTFLEQSSLQSNIFYFSCTNPSLDVGVRVYLQMTRVSS